MSWGWCDKCRQPPGLRCLNLLFATRRMVFSFYIKRPHRGRARS